MVEVHLYARNNDRGDSAMSSVANISCPPTSEIVDIRTVEMDTCEPVVLEVNANCGLSFEKGKYKTKSIRHLTGGCRTLHMII